MRPLGVIVVVLGVLSALSGLIFIFQGMGIVGPSSSFMFQNPSWIEYGVVFLIVGLAMIGIGYRLRTNRPVQVSNQ
jgi:TRAP-type C4-dicarboxylate transport system permease small subunit